MSETANYALDPTAEERSEWMRLGVASAEVTRRLCVQIIRLQARNAVLLAALRRCERAIMATHSGGDLSMIFDRYDAEVERERKGWYSVDRTEFDAAMADADRALTESEEARDG